MIQPSLDPALTIVLGDRLPDLIITIRDQDGNPRNITGFTADFYMIKHDEPTTPKVNYAAMSIIDLPTGIVSYSWGPSDTDTAGIYYWRVRLTQTIGGKKQHTLWRCLEIETPPQHPLRTF